MSDQKEKEVIVSIDEWVDKAKADPEAYLERQATEIFLTTLGTTEPYCQKFFLKGGLLMGIVYESPRHTSDIDYSTDLEPNPETATHLTSALNEAFPRTAARLGYLDLVCAVQKVKLRPREDNFANAQAPGFEITVGYAKRGSAQEKKVAQRKAAKVLHADVSFKEPVGAIQIVRFGEQGVTIPAYSLKDMITEKYRAFLQQEKRNRLRRQDIYDLSLLLGRFTFDDQEKKEMLDLLILKCKARDISPTQDSLEDEANISRAKSEWDTMSLEIGPLPSFDTCFAVANSFYRSLPWTVGE